MNLLRYLIRLENIKEISDISNISNLDILESSVDKIIISSTVTGEINSYKRLVLFHFLKFKISNFKILKK